MGRSPALTPSTRGRRAPSPAWFKLMMSLTSPSATIYLCRYLWWGAKGGALHLANNPGREETRGSPLLSSLPWSVYPRREVKQLKSFSQNSLELLETSEQDRLWRHTRKRKRGGSRSTVGKRRDRCLRTGMGGGWPPGGNTLSAPFLGLCSAFLQPLALKPEGSRLSTSTLQLQVIKNSAKSA